MSQATRALTLQFLDWTRERPRTYGEAMDAWRTSCPRLSIWEDAIADGLVEVRPALSGRMNDAAVRLTTRGSQLMALAT